jgi:hypothetical protein
MIFYILHMQTSKPHKKIVRSCFKHAKGPWNIINLYQVWNIETLQVIEHKKENKLTKKCIMLPLWCFKD